MIFVDTNYFLRFLLRAENRSQHEAAKKVFLEAAGGKVELFTSLIVIFEIYWVLSSFYGQKKAEITEILLNILKMEFISIPERLLLEEALKTFAENNISLEDSYNLACAKHSKAEDFLTFDRKLKRLFSGKKILT